MQGRVAEAGTLFSQLLEQAETPVAIRADCYHGLGRIRDYQHKATEAQAYYITAATTDFVSLRFQVMLNGLIKPALLTPEQYLAYLQKVLMLVPAEQANAEFAGKIKSQFNLLK